MKTPPASSSTAGTASPEFISYLDLIDENPAPRASRTQPLDVIVVPAGRPIMSLDSIAQLALTTSATLVVLCSKSALRADAAEELRKYRKLTWYAVDVPPTYQHQLLELKASSVVTPSGLLNTSDLSKKRNIGLLLGKAAGGRILFLDDDIVLTTHSLQEATRLLPSYSMIGFRPHPQSFPDNSVAVHALRTLKKLNAPLSNSRTLPVGQHISGNSLIVNVLHVTEPFPERIYDEDWLFMYDALIRKEVALAKAVSRQLAYDPFSTPLRAASEEFGNTISKGLYDNLRSTDRTQLLHRHYWKNILEGRKKRLETLHAASGPPAIRASLEAAIQTNRLIDPELCITYYRTWRADKADWVARFMGLPLSGGIGQMLSRLELSRYTTKSPEDSVGTVGG